MNYWRYGLVLLVAGASLAVVGCGDGDDLPTGPGPADFISITPRGGAMGVPVGTPIELRWSGAMASGMEQFVDLHRNDLAGPVIPMNCDWSADRTTLRCNPLSPLRPGTQYVVHAGGGMIDMNGEVVDMMHGPGYGGEWIQGGMMSGGHGGMDWGAMGGYWRHPNGAFGMAFTFTTS